VPPPKYSTLLKTKISIPPPRPQLVSRTRLLSRLTEGTARPLTLICATAGFGKTTLVTDWIRASGERTHVAWLSLDEDDKDPVSYFIAALQIVEPEIGRAPLSLLGSLSETAGRWHISAGQASGLKQGDELWVMGWGEIVRAPTGVPAGWIPASARAGSKWSSSSGETSRRADWLRGKARAPVTSSCCPARFSDSM
jgi:hypothetical protein